MSYEDVFIKDYNDAPEGHTFSNSTDFEIFYNRHCDSCVFEQGQECSLILVALMGRVPVDWTRTENSFACSRRKVSDE